LPVTPSLPGIWPALLTPLDAHLNIDHTKFAAHARALIAAGCGGVTPFGTTGEGPSFSLDERRAAIDALVEGGVPGSKILVSTSCAALPETLALTKHALSVGAWGCLMLPPFFLKGVSDEGIVDAYRYVIDQSGNGAADPRLRIMLYHIPQVAGVGLSHAVIAELKRRYPDTIIGIKDSQCDRAHSIALAEAFMSSVTVHVGNEPDLPEMGRRGSTGAVSGLANFMPRLVHRLVTGFDSPAAAQDLARTQQLLGILGGYALMPALKGIMTILSGDPAWLRVRPPLVALTSERLAALEKQIRAFGIDPARD
jgi:4-hydroxy-tetrahydrodipicolinate synthase